MNYIKLDEANITFDSVKKKKNFFEKSKQILFSYKENLLFFYCAY
jgi:hypothetical protein